LNIIASFKNGHWLVFGVCWPVVSVGCLLAGGYW